MRGLSLENFAIYIGFPLLTTMENLVTLSLDQIQPAAYFPRMLYSNGFYTCLIWRYLGSPLKLIIPAATLRDNYCVPGS